MALLWNPESWSQRLAELQAESGELKEAPLRRDVRSLGMLLGEVLREQAGEELFAQVEELRQGTIRRREAEARRHAEEAARFTPRMRWRWCIAARRAGAAADARLRLLLRAHQPGRDQPPQAPPPCAAT
jgi:phosphoenolpyruvate carboxylase